MNIDFENDFEAPVLVGEGGTGKVYRVKEKSTGVFYALKILENEKLWDTEVTILNEADHELFPHIIASGKEDGKCYILMEYIWGDNLAEVILRRKGFAQAEAMRMALMIADGLGWLQTKERPVIFRDLKAENIIMSPDGSVRLIDLGSACFAKDAEKAITGTEGISAPEQFEGKAGLYSDVYAFGKLFRFMLTGNRDDEYLENGMLRPITDYDPMFSYSLELLLEDCTGIVPEDRLPDMYCVTKRMVDIASQSPRQYKKSEKLAKAAVAKRVAGASEGKMQVKFQKNIKQ